MKWFKFIWIAFQAVVLCTACRQDPNSDEGGESIKQPSLSIGIQIPGSTQSKADLAGVDPENAINNLIIWVFRNDDKNPVWGEPMKLTSDQLPEPGNIGWYSYKVSWGFITERPDVDVFAVANVETIGRTLDELAAINDYETVSKLAFGVDATNDFFGITQPVRKSYEELNNPTTQGFLPMSGMRTGMKVTGSGQQLKVESLQIKRAVSRIRMVFCKTATDDPDADKVKINGITLYDDLFPLKEYVFTENATGIVRTEGNPDDDNYVGSPYSVPASDLALLTNETIKSHPYPESLVYINQNPQEYQTKLDEAAHPADPANATLTDLGYFYFRESDRVLRGRIDYGIQRSIDQDYQPRLREFSMALPGDFARNHTWTLFAYFMSGRNLQFSLVAQPWDKTDYYIDFTDQAITVTSKFVVDETGAEVLSEGAYRELKLKPGVPVKGNLTISTPVGGLLYIRPEGAPSFYNVKPERIEINPTRDNGNISILIEAKSGVDTENLPEIETTLTLSFTVEMNGREIDANSEIIDTRYRFHR